MNEIQNQNNSNSVKLTTRGRYAVMAMVELARSDRGAPVPLSGIAATNDISLSYLEQLVAALRRAGLVKSYRGPGGGYILGKPAADIMVSQILIAAEDSTPGRKAANDDAVTQACDQTYMLWQHIGALLHATLKTVSLRDVAQGSLKDALSIQQKI